MSGMECVVVALPVATTFNSSDISSFTYPQKKVNNLC